jgi:hypothetical protein
MRGRHTGVPSDCSHAAPALLPLPFQFPYLEPVNRVALQRRHDRHQAIVVVQRLEAEARDLDQRRENLEAAVGVGLSQQLWAGGRVGGWVGGRAGWWVGGLVRWSAGRLVGA